MKTQLRLGPHTVLAGAQVVEVWYGDVLIATVTGADGPGVRIISKHRIVASDGHASSIAVHGSPANAISVEIGT